MGKPRRKGRKGGREAYHAAPADVAAAKALAEAGGRCAVCGGRSVLVAEREDGRWEARCIAQRVCRRRAVARWRAEDAEEGS